MGSEVTAKQIDLLQQLVHEAFCRGYDSGYHDASDDHGLSSLRTRFAPWSVDEVSARVAVILREGN